ncbi:hypothetical protein NQ314_014177 [Rhamnusium bicolor]|uniref:Uncharacterized protein n=1 Tax=Rhamnusium bicolor TaxID=1586634 RepID=A0AAV8X3P9_9CUCU|nr:hypothetical protein NQ314_014177 [Rhamnusium bicolor]
MSEEEYLNPIEEEKIELEKPNVPEEVTASAKTSPKSGIAINEKEKEIKDTTKIMEEQVKVEDDVIMISDSDDEEKNDTRKDDVNKEGGYMLNILI